MGFISSVLSFLVATLAATMGGCNRGTSENLCMGGSVNRAGTMSAASSECGVGWVLMWWGRGGV